MANIAPEPNPVTPPMPYKPATYPDTQTPQNTVHIYVNLINGQDAANYHPYVDAPTITINSYTQVDPYSDSGGNTSALGFNSVIYKYGYTTQVTGTNQGYSPGGDIRIITPSTLISGGATNADIGVDLYILYYTNLIYRALNQVNYTLPPSFFPVVTPTENNPGGVQTGYRIRVQPCGIPTSLSGTSYHNTQVPLTWTIPSDDGGGVLGAITNYIIQYNITGIGPWSSQVTTPSSSTSYTITGLTNGTTYYFQVAAINGYCNSGGPTSGYFSTTASAVPATLPDQPASLNALSGPGAGQIHVSWVAPSYPSQTGGLPINTYTLRYRISGSVSWTNTTLGPTLTNYTITGLANDTTYDIELATNTDAGTSIYSAVFATTYGLPGSPTDLSGVHGNQLVTLTWTAPSDGGTPIIEYLVEYSTSSSGPWTQILTGSTAITYPVTGLTNGTLYHFRVSAINLVGTGPPSSPTSVTPSTTPGPPVVSSETCDNQQVLVTWSPPIDDGGAPILSYYLRYSTITTGPWLPTSGPYNILAPTTSYLVTGLINGTPYYFQVAALNFNGVGTYSASSTATPSITPQPPNPITTTAITSTSITLSWTAPTNTGGNPVTGYIIYLSEISSTGSIISTTPITISGTPPPTTYTIPNLTHATLYEIQISSISCSGVGPISSPALYVTTSSIPPSAPTNVVIANCNTGYTNSVILTWTAPIDDGGSPITNYVIYYRTSSVGSSPAGLWYTYNTNSSATTATISFLTPGISYDFKVAAQNAAGVGIFSSPIVSSSSYNPPTAPTNLVATTNSNGFVVLTWTASTQEAPQTISYYVIEYKLCEFGGWITYPTTIPSPTTSATIIDSNIANNLTYLYRVYAVNSCGARSDPSNEASATSYNNNEPTRLWSRFNLNCSGNINSIDNLDQAMLRKAQVLQYPVVGTLQFSKGTLWSMAAKNQLTRKKAWASQSEEYVYPNITNINNEPGVGLKQTPTSLVPWIPLPSVICNPSGASDVPGSPSILCYSKNAPFNNYRKPITYSSGGTKFPLFFSK